MTVSRRDLSLPVPVTKAHVAATFTPLRDMREAVLDEIGELAHVTYLRDVSRGERRDVITSADAILGWSLSQELTYPDEFRLLGSVKLIQVLSAGVEGLPLSWIPGHVPVASNAGGYARPMAEHVLAMALALAKHLPQRHHELSEGEFKRQTPNRDVSGSIVGIVGFGGIGRATAGLFRAFGARVHAITRSDQVDGALEWAGTLEHLDELLARADIVVLSIPLNDETRGLITRRELSRMKRDAILINVARAHIVDEGDLFEHLVENPQFSAGLDVWWHETPDLFATQRRFLDLPNVMGSPHNSADTYRSLYEASRHAAANVARALRNEPVQNLIPRRDHGPASVPQ